MDVKTLSSVVGHKSVATALDIYAHTTDAMQQEPRTALTGGAEKRSKQKQEPGKTPEDSVPFIPVKGIRRRLGTGCITQISEKL